MISETVRQHALVAGIVDFDLKRIIFDTRLQDRQRRHNVALKRLLVTVVVGGKATVL